MTLIDPQFDVPHLMQNHRALTFEHLELGNRIFKPSSCKLIFPLKSLRTWNFELMKSIWDNFRELFSTLTTWYLIFIGTFGQLELIWAATGRVGQNKGRSENNSQQDYIIVFPYCSVSTWYSHIGENTSRTLPLKALIRWSDANYNSLQHQNQSNKH